ncbi:MAG: hypothetical protein L0227_15470, partial [Chloroflexi bacterium]|nr:hypothetical protein [Chloroflexota bacterium]
SDLGAGPPESSVRGKGVEVSATTRERVAPIVAGAAAAAVGISGAITVVEIDGLTEAFVQRSDVSSQGDLRIVADDTATINTGAGVLSGGFLGAGGTFAVNAIRNTTRARASGSTLNATGLTLIEADSDEAIDTLVGTAAGGAIALAGAVSVNTIETTTEALTRTTSGRDTLINQDAAFQPGGTFNPGSGQSVRVEADDAARIGARGGSLAGGVFGAGVSVDVGAIRNRTVAEIDDDTLVFAQGNIDVLAVEDRDVESTVVAGSGGVLALAGAFSVVSLGAATDDDAAAAFDTDDAEQTDPNKDTLREQINSDLRIRLPQLNTGDGAIATQARDKVQAMIDAGSPTVDAALSTTAPSSTRTTAARIADATGSGTAAELVAGGNITISATTTYDVDVTAGTATVGVGAGGIATGTASVANRTEAEAGNFASLQAGGNVSISAADRQKASSTQSTVLVVSGQLSLSGASGAIGTLSVASNTDAVLGSNAVIQAADSASVTADYDANVNVEGRGLLVSGAAAGGVTTTATVGGFVDATLQDGATVGGTGEVGS